MEVEKISSKPLFILKCELIKDHIIVEGNILLDTGSPVSMSIDDRSLKISEELVIPVFPSEKILLCVEKHTGLKIKYLIGTDFLSKYSFILKPDCIEFYPSEFVVNKSSTEYSEFFEYDVISNHPCFVLRVDCNDLYGPKYSELKTFFDTGAPINYLACKYTENVKDSGKVVKDFHPSCGSFETKIWNLEICIVNENEKEKENSKKSENLENLENPNSSCVFIKEEFGVLPQFLESGLMGMFDIDCVIGTSIMKRGYCVSINLMKKKIVFFKSKNARK